ncbi:MAG TPA: hypothetical protein VGF48_23690 [Thermoanaerobaculia bacterium]|jgi:hypothetical protein
MKAGLTHSVGQASIGIRVLLAVVSLVTAMLCIGGGRYIAATSPMARALAVILVMPIGFIVFAAAAFCLAPHSRYGQQLDEFVPRLRDPKFAIGTPVVLWLVGFYATR